jgi:anti-sigma B factor antagonist
MNERFTVTSTTGEADETTIRMQGDLDLAADAALSDAYARGTVANPSRVVLDFTRVGYINSTGIALIVRLLAEARRDRREVIALGLSDHYQEIFRLTRLSDYVTIVDASPAPTELEGAAQ